MKLMSIKLVAFCGFFGRAESLFAHDGHGLLGSHWHATDVWGFGALGLAIVAAIWFMRSGK